MDRKDIAPLMDHLRECADIWSAANDAPLGRLGRLAINDGGFFARVDERGISPTTTTLERFARFLGDVGNWPGEAVPPQVRGFVERVGGHQDAANGKAAAA